MTDRRRLTAGGRWSVVSVITERSDQPVRLPPAARQFILHWGKLGGRWGVNRSVGQIHALLFVSDRPLTAEAIAGTLGIARSNVSSSLKELQAWDIIRTVPVLRDTRSFYVAETDPWTLVSRIASGRKSREPDPAAAALRNCLAMAEGDMQVSAIATRRLREMLDIVERTGRWYDQTIRLPRAQIFALMKPGAGMVRLLDRGRPKVRSERVVSH